jgi:hypothetical protein
MYVDLLPRGVSDVAEVSLSDLDRDLLPGGMSDVAEVGVSDLDLDLLPGGVSDVAEVGVSDLGQVLGDEGHEIKVGQPRYQLLRHLPHVSPKTPSVERLPWYHTIMCCDTVCV